MQAEDILATIDRAKQKATEIVKSGGLSLYKATRGLNPVSTVVSGIDTVRKVSNLPINTPNYQGTVRSLASDAFKNTQTGLPQTLREGFVIPKRTPTGWTTENKPTVPSTWVANRVVAPAMNVPESAKQVKTGFQKVMGGDIKGGGVEAGIGALGVVGGLSPGPEDLAFSMYDATKARMAGRDRTKGFTGEEYTGLGTAINAGKDTPVANVLNTAELPMLLLAGGLKAKSAKKIKGIDPTEALKVEARKYKSAEEFVDTDKTISVPIKDFSKTDSTSWNEAINNVSKGELSKTNGPVEVVMTPNGYKLVEGNHRAVQALQAGKDSIEAKVISKEGLDKIAQRDGPHVKMNMQDTLTRQQLTDLYNQSQLPKSGVNPSTLGVTPPNLKQLNQPKLPDELQLPPSVKPKIAAKTVVGQEPIINTKRDIPIKDVFGNKAVLPAGEAYTPHLTSDNKIILKDGEQFLVNKSTYDNVKGQSVKSEAKPFAPELEGLEESVMGGIDDNYRTKLSDMKSELSNILNMRGRTDKQLKRASQLTKEIDRLEKMDSAKYSQYTLPGGNNYREILIKAPTRSENALREANADKLAMEKYGKTMRELWDSNDFAKWDDISKSNSVNYENNFKSSHWNEPNVLAHIRMNDRVTPDGKKVAFMEELQSDWAREARKNSPELNMGKLDAHSRQLYNKPFSELTDGLKKQVKHDLRLEDTPNHPLLKNWQEPTIKRALKDAVDNDAEYFAWINGDQTSARYNLATYVDDVNWSKPEYSPYKRLQINAKQGKSWDVNVKNDGTIAEGGAVPSDWIGKKLDEVIGKGVAEKIMADASGTLSGEGLKFGGEWANNLYDKQVKSIVEKLTGGKVEELDLGIPTPIKETTQSNSHGQTLDAQLSDLIYESKNADEVIERWKNEWGEPLKMEVVLAAEKDYGLERSDIFTELKKRAVPLENTVYQQAIRLTPEIKARIRGEAPPIKQPSGKTPDLIKAFSGKSTQAKGMGSNIGTKEFSYTPATNLSKKHQAIESKFGNYLKNNLKKAETIYREKFGNVINTDNARELSADYVKDKERLSAAVHEPASSFVKSLYSDMLHEPVSPGKNKTVLMLSGGTGAGKTSAIRDLGLGETAQIIYDSNMSGLDSTVKKIEQALDSGFKVDFDLVLRDPIDSFTNGAVPRAVRMGRTVPLEQHVQTHVGSLDVFKKLVDKYKKNKNVRFQVIENNAGRNNASLRSIDFVNDIVYNKQDISNSVKNELERLYGNGTITKKHHEGFTGYTEI